MGILATVRPLARAVTRAAGNRRRRRGRLRVPGLRSDVEVLYSEGHVPHLYASSEDDLFFAQGWLTASERLWQMDFLRRAAQGRLAEILGEREVAWRELTILLRGRTTVDVDHLLRLAGIAPAARASWPLLEPATRRILERYAQGVNARIAEGRLPLEFRLLRYRPEPWTPQDSLAVQRALAFELAPTWRAILALEGLRAAIAAPERLAALLPIASVGPHPLVPEAARLAALAAAEEHQTALGGPHVGSNAWAVGPARSASRAPLLCNDPHLPLTAPGPFFLAHLAGDGFDVAGATLPGLPGVLIGHNREIAWGITLVLAQDADLYTEAIAADGTYRVDGGRLPLEVERTEIAVRGRATKVIREIRRTRHGPLLTDLFEPPHETASGLALRWTGQEPSREMDALLGVNRATDWSSFRAALRHHGAPALHFCYADRAGHIGYQLAGRVPRRASGDDLAVRDGATDPGWASFVPWEDLPSLFDPAEGIVATANQLVVDESYPHHLTHLAEPPWRYRRIRSMLGGERRLTAEEMISVQLDLYSGWAERLTEALLVPLAAEESGSILTQRGKEVLARILAWDHVARSESDGAALFYLFHDALVRELLEEALGGDRLRAWLELLNASVVPIERLLVEGKASWLSPEDRRAACARALDRAAAAITQRLGADPAGWRWGALHTARLRHRLDPLRPLRPLLSPGPFETGGDGMTINNGHYVHAEPWEHRVGAVYRQIFDLADWDRSRVITCSGQSGDPLSRHYRDQLPLWAQGDYLPLPFGRAAVERAAATAGRLQLAPPA